jgi:cholesterol oxidase
MYDVIIIGSGFGGAVTACRLAEQGMKVLVLERGRRWEHTRYPRDVGDPWIFNHLRPEHENGWLDLRIYKHMMIAQGAGVGGGSLIYANISVEAKKELFNQGWPSEITYDELKPYYDRVGKMLNVQTVPDGQMTERTRVMKEGATAIGHGDRFRLLPLAVTFNPEWNYQLTDARSDTHSKEWINDQGVQQGTCVHCGNCCIGCQVKAKNTLDLNYLARAEKMGAEIRPLHLVRFIKPENGSYGVYFDRLKDNQCIPGNETARRVIVSAGSLGSTELLLRCRDQYRSLPNLSQSLGHNWSSNGDFLTPAFHSNREISPTYGPTITSAIDFLDGSVDNQQFFIEDGGFPDLLGDFLQQRLKSRPKHALGVIVMDALRRIVRARDPLGNVMPWFAQGIDAGDGRLFLGRPWFAPWRKVLKLDWEVSRSVGVIDAIVKMHERLAKATGADPFVPPTWRPLKNLITPHPLGGCNMGRTAVDGVVNHKGEVFGYSNLYVADGSIVPEAVGLNPSRTIAALAERIAVQMSK